MNGHEILAAMLSLDVDELMTDRLEDACRNWAALEDANRVLAIVRGEMAKMIGEELPEKEWTVDGLGTVSRHYKKNRTEWDKDGLLRDVLDARLVDGKTGEIKDQTPLERVLYVWNLPAPRTTALKALGLDPDEYCRSTPGGVNLQLIRPDQGVF